jgi:hypothetical protein
MLDASRLSGRAMAMGRFQLVFRREGKPDSSEYRFNDHNGEPRIDGRPIVDGEVYVIRGVEWLVQREDGDFNLHRHGGDQRHRFICTLVVGSTRE